MSHPPLICAPVAALCVCQPRGGSRQPRILPRGRHMWGAVEDEIVTINHRPRKQGGLNCDIMILFVLRSALLLRATSISSGANDSTGGRLVTTFKIFLRGDLQHVAHLPLSHEFEAAAPQSVQVRGLFQVAILLDAQRSTMFDFFFYFQQLLMT